jgi:plasmid stabilization system protein ParE
MRNTVVISDAAAADIAEQFDYIRLVKQEPANAETWLRGLYAAVEALEEFAGYALAPESAFLGIELRQRVFKSHRIVYSFDEQNREVTIHYVRHGARRRAGEPDENE